MRGRGRAGRGQQRGAWERGAAVHRASRDYNVNYGQWDRPPQLFAVPAFGIAATAEKTGTGGEKKKSPLHAGGQYVRGSRTQEILPVSPSGGGGASERRSPSESASSQRAGATPRGSPSLQPPRRALGLLQRLRGHHRSALPAVSVHPYQLAINRVQGSIALALPTERPARRANSLAPDPDPQRPTRHKTC